MAKVDIKKLNQLVEIISSVASLDFSKKIDDVKGDGTALDTIAIGLNMLSEELEYSVVSIDALEEKNTELQEVILKMNEFKYALDSSSIVAMTDTKGNITYVNEQFCKISKYSREELIGRNQRIVSSGYHSPGFWFEMWKTIRSGSVWNNEVRNRAKDGSIYWVNTTIVPFLNNRGTPYKYISIRRDITNSKLIEMQVMQSIISSNEQDRELFAEDLHEGLAQSLAALMMQVGVIELKVKDVKDQQLQDSINFIKDYIQESIKNTRLIATSLMPRTMMEYGIEPSLRAFISSVQKEGLRYIQFKCTIETPIKKDIEITLYRTIVLLIDKFRTSNVSSVFILIDHRGISNLYSLIKVKCSEDEIACCSIEDLILESNKKRIELLGGCLNVQKSKEEIKLMIQF